MSQYTFIIFIALFLLTLVQSNLPTCSDPACIQCNYQITQSNYIQSCKICKQEWSLINNACVRPSCSIQNCLNCDQQKKYCIQCRQPYYLSAEACRPKLYIIMVPVSICFLSLILCWWISICKVKSRRNNTENRQSRGLQSDINMNRNINRQNMANGAIYNDQIASSQANINIEELNNNNFDYFKEICTICLEEKCNLITKCKHCFHVQCFWSWNRRNGNCPVCMNKNTRMVGISICQNCHKLWNEYDIKDYNLRNRIKQDLRKQCQNCQIIVVQDEECGKNIMQ